VIFVISKVDNANMEYNKDTLEPELYTFLMQKPLQEFLLQHPELIISLQNILSNDWKKLLQAQQIEEISHLRNPFGSILSSYFTSKKTVTDLLDTLDKNDLRNAHQAIMDALKLPELSIELEHRLKKGNRDPISIKNSLRDYKRFLLLIRENPNRTIVPSVDIDEVWHAHLLCPVAYIRDCFKIFGKGVVLDHGRNLTEEKDQKEAEKYTVQLWRMHFHEEYIVGWCAGSCHYMILNILQEV